LTLQQLACQLKLAVKSGVVIVIIFLLNIWRRLFFMQHSRIQSHNHKTYQYCKQTLHITNSVTIRLCKS